MFLMLATRPDLDFCCGLLSRYSSAPTSTHYGLAKRILRYIRGTSSCGLTLGGNELVVGWSDAAFGDDLDTGRSTHCYIFTVGLGAVTWSSRLQSILTLSTCEAEYVALTEAA